MSNRDQILIGGFVSDLELTTPRGGFRLRHSVRRLPCCQRHQARCRRHRQFLEQRGCHLLLRLCPVRAIPGPSTFMVHIPRGEQKTDEAERPERRISCDNTHLTCCRFLDDLSSQCKARIWPNFDPPPAPSMPQTSPAGGCTPPNAQPLLEALGTQKAVARATTDDLYTRIAELPGQPRESGSDRPPVGTPNPAVALAGRTLGRQTEDGSRRWRGRTDIPRESDLSDDPLISGSVVAPRWEQLLDQSTHELLRLSCACE
ncbi:hypothetical protein SRB5_03630 [Streptomyces sp. RB5]|uniref:Uncharacterized protein n=1 Tax=Streptomyces smaragdinus TaxID=2585196 RepID=A0A7K0CA36_9ACTN|nr:hypothetical protein [Streptomyces smaragdinus]